MGLGATAMVALDHRVRRQRSTPILPRVAEEEGDSPLFPVLLAAMAEVEVAAFEQRAAPLKLHRQRPCLALERLVKVITVPRGCFRGTETRVLVEVVPARLAHPEQPARIPLVVMVEAGIRRI